MLKNFIFSLLTITLHKILILNLVSIWVDENFFSNIITNEISKVWNDTKLTSVNNGDDYELNNIDKNTLSSFNNFTLLLKNYFPTLDYYNIKLFKVLYKIIRKIISFCKELF